MNDIELTEGDMGQLRILMAQLATISSACDGHIEQVEIHAVVDGQPYVIGYGEAGEPAVLIPSPSIA